MHRTFARTTAAVAAAAAVLLAATSCSAPAEPDPIGDGSGTGGEGTWSTAEVLEGSDGRVEVPLFAVPKQLDPILLAYLNPGLSVPTFKDWQQGMSDAADFYGIDLVDSDLNLKYDTALTAYQTLAVREPTVVGSGAGAANEALLSATESDGAPLVLIDQDLAGAESFGVDNEAVGDAGGQLLVDAADERTTGQWADANIVYLGVSAPGCGPCDTRVRTGADTVSAGLDLAGGSTFFLAPDNTGLPAAMTDFLTAHPDDKVLFLSYGDGPAVAMLNALQQADRLDDAAVVSLGGDASGREALRDSQNADTFIGALDFNPYAEGWNWVEAAIATHLGQPFGTYDVERVITPANVTDLYPND